MFGDAARSTGSQGRLATLLDDMVNMGWIATLHPDGPWQGVHGRLCGFVGTYAYMKQHGVEVENTLFEAPWKNVKLERLGALSKEVFAGLSAKCSLRASTT